MRTASRPVFEKWIFLISLDIRIFGPVERASCCSSSSSSTSHHVAGRYGLFIRHKSHTPACTTISSARIRLGYPIGCTRYDILIELTTCSMGAIWSDQACLAKKQNETGRVRCAVATRYLCPIFLFVLQYIVHRT